MSVCYLVVVIKKRQPELAAAYVVCGVSKSVGCCRRAVLAFFRVVASSQICPPTIFVLQRYNFSFNLATLALQFALLLTAYLTGRRVMRAGELAEVRLTTVSLTNSTSVICGRMVTISSSMVVLGHIMRVMPPSLRVTLVPSPV